MAEGVLTSERRAQVVDICRSLVKIESLSGAEGAVIERVAGWMRELGYQDVRIDGCGNLTGILVGTGDGPTVLYDSHVDTVSAEDADAWRFGGPFSGELADDRIWGRGSTDMKGPLAASLAGLAYAAQDGVLRGHAVVSASVGEEIIEGLAFQQVVHVINPAVVIICEPTALRLNIAGRGRAEVTVTLHGKSAHASTPHLGVNALRQMAKLILALDNWVPPEDPQLGLGILEPTEIVSTPFPSVSMLPFRCRARYDRRLLVGEDEDAVLNPIRAVIAGLSAADPTFRAEANVDTGAFTCYTGHTLHGRKFQPAWRFAPDADHVRAALAALSAAALPAETGHYGFCTNGSYTAGVAGIPTLGYGPGHESAAHTTDESLELDQLFGATAGYYALGAMAL
jgi:putative selenium metabolism hydrolase